MGVTTARHLGEEAAAHVAREALPQDEGQVVHDGLILERERGGGEEGGMGKGGETDGWAGERPMVKMEAGIGKWSKSCLSGTACAFACPFSLRL